LDRDNVAWSRANRSNRCGFVHDAALGAASLAALLDLLNEPGAPCVLRKARQPDLAHFGSVLRVASAVKGKRQTVEGPWNVAADVDRFTPQTYGFLEPPCAFEVSGEVVSYPPEKLRPSLMARGLDSRPSHRGRILPLLGGGERLGKSVSVFG
jgi:hypothetical protein